MKLIERIKLAYRAYRYSTKDDRGGIAYINAAIQQGQTVFDIGAHKAGYLYCMLNKVGKKGRVYAFEPQLKLYRYIYNIKHSLQWDNVTIEHLALSDTAGTTTLYIPQNNVSTGSSPGATIVADKASTTQYTTEDVATETLDAYCARLHAAPAFLKIDVEGNELRVLKGGIATLQKHKPRILVEIEARHVGEQRATETFRFLEGLGYRGYVLYGLERLPLADFSFEKHQNVTDKNNYCNNFVFEQ
ncbi:MAG: hypothetical protein RLZZ367_1496 [Bacteroidota bacterium]|jgi:FkbM family methyltransferase